MIIHWHWFPEIKEPPGHSFKHSPLNKYFDSEHSKQFISFGPLHFEHVESQTNSSFFFFICVRWKKKKNSTKTMIMICISKIWTF